jgi:outer membrane receptor protein involved in Fe transport
MVTNYSHSAQNYFDTQHITNALNVVTDTRVGSPTLGQPVCQSVIDGSDTSCVPYNIFQVGPNGQTMVTPAMLAYLQVPGYDGGLASERVVDLNVTGNLGAYGVRSPFAKDGVSVSAGGEYRGQSVSYYADYLLTNGFLSGTSGVSIPLAQSFNVYEAFAEVRVPLAQDIILLKNVEFEGAYRYSNYSFGKDTHTFKVGGEWEFLEDMRIRSSWQRAVRAPSITELYSPDAVQLDGATDPCAGLTAGDPLVATCAAAFGLTTAQVLAIVPNPAAQYNGLLGGNANLNPESSDTVSVGFVVQPTFLRGLQLSVDYFTIKVNGAVSTIGADLILKNCLSGANPAYCSLVHRDAQGSLWLSPQGYVVDTNQNVSFLGTSGIDVNLLYALRLRDIGAGKMGTVSLAFNGTWLATQTTQPTVTQATYDCTGLYGTVCGIPNPLWRHKMKLTWDAPLGLSVAAQMRYLSAVGLDANSSQAALNNPGQVAISDLSLGARAYFDLVGSWTIADMFTFRAGVNNVLDTDPPLAGSSNLTIDGGANGNTVPQVYDALGRYIFLSGTANF